MSTVDSGSGLAPALIGELARRLAQARRSRTAIPKLSDEYRN